MSNLVVILLATILGFVPASNDVPTQTHPHTPSVAAIGPTKPSDTPTPPITITPTPAISPTPTDTIAIDNPPTEKETDESDVDTSEKVPAYNVRADKALPADIPLHAVQHAPALEELSPTPSSIQPIDQPTKQQPPSDNFSTDNTNKLIPHPRFNE